MAILGLWQAGQHSEGTVAEARTVRRRAGRALGDGGPGKGSEHQGQGQWGWPQNKGASVASRAEAGGGGAEVGKVRSCGASQMWGGVWSFMQVQ